MAYLILGNNQEKIKEVVKKLIERLWERNISENPFEIENPDLHILTSKNIKSIGIQDVKDLQKEMIFTPYIEKIQIALIPFSEKLTHEAQNSFLKVLEESSKTSEYILCTNNENNLLPTVISRCQKIYSQQEKEKTVKSNQPDLFSKDLITAFNEIESISKDNKKIDQLLTDLEQKYQNLLKEKIDKGEKIDRVSRDIKEVIKTRERIQANGNKRLQLERLYIVLTT